MRIDIFGAQPQNCIYHVLCHREKPAFQGIWQRHIAGDKEKISWQKNHRLHERCDVEAENRSLRKKRKAFYMRNGYKETGYRIKLSGMVQELLIWNGEFVKKSFVLFLHVTAMEYSGQKFGKRQKRAQPNRHNSIEWKSSVSCIQKKRKIYDA